MRRRPRDDDRFESRMAVGMLARGSQHETRTILPRTMARVRGPRAPWARDRARISLGRARGGPRPTVRIDSMVMGSRTSWTCVDAFGGERSERVGHLGCRALERRRTVRAVALEPARPAGEPNQHGHRPGDGLPGRGRRRGTPRRRRPAAARRPDGRVPDVRVPAVPRVGVRHRHPQHPRPVRADEQRRAVRVVARAAAARSRAPGRTARRSRSRHPAGASG